MMGNPSNEEEFVDVWMETGEIFDNMRRYDDALLCFNRVVEVSPKNFYAWFKRGIMLAELGRNDEALESYNKAHQIAPFEKFLLVAIYETLDGLGREKEAEACLDEMEKIKKTGGI